MRQRQARDSGLDAEPASKGRGGEANAGQAGRAAASAPRQVQAAGLRPHCSWEAGNVQGHAGVAVLRGGSARILTVFHRVQAGESVRVGVLVRSSLLLVVVRMLLVVGSILLCCGLVPLRRHVLRRGRLQLVGGWDVGGVGSIGVALQALYRLLGILRSIQVGANLGGRSVPRLLCGHYCIGDAVFRVHEGRADRRPSVQGTASAKLRCPAVSLLTQEPEV